MTFIMEFAKMLDVINRLASNDKVVYLANLFGRSFINRPIEEYDIDTFEEYLHRLDYLSFREIDLLIRLYNYQKLHKKDYHNEWFDFKEEVSTELSLSNDDT